MSILSWTIPLISLIFLKRFPVFPILLFSYISLHCSFEVFLFLLAILFTSHHFPSLHCLVETMSDFFCGGGGGGGWAPKSLQMVIGKKVMTNLDSILKSRDIITLPTKVRKESDTTERLNWTELILWNSSFSHPTEWISFPFSLAFHFPCFLSYL